MKSKKYRVWADVNFFENNDLDYTHCYTHKNCTVDMHTHTFYEINVVSDGVGTHHIYNTDIVAKKGCVFIIPPNTPHSYKNNDNLSVKHVLISNKFFKQYEQELSSLSSFEHLFNGYSFLPTNNYSLLLEDKNFETFQSYWNVLYGNHLDDKLPANKQNEDFIISDGLVLSLISFLCSVYKSQQTPQKQNIFKDIYAVSNAINYMHDNYDQKISTEQLAKICNMSSSTFLRYFKKTLKTTPANYLTAHRVACSKILLKSGNHSITEIAQATGFFDSAHFTKAFKKLTGISPLQYKNDDSEK